MKKIYHFTLTLFTLAWLIYLSVNISISEFYHPNHSAASYGAYYLWLFAMLALCNLAVVYTLQKRYPNRITKVFLAGILSLLVLVSSHHLSLSVERNHSVRYYIDDVPYSIPWQYNPINGSIKKGGTYFVIHVSYPNFIAQYSDKNYYESRLTISKSKLEAASSVGSELTDVCRNSDNLCQQHGTLHNGYFSDNDFEYSFHYHGKGKLIFRSAEDVTSFKKKVKDLINSFKEK